MDVSGDPRSDLVRGLHGHLDLPAADSVVTPGALVVGGWVFHERFPVSQVVVTVDGAIAGTTVPTSVREDVREAFPTQPAAERSGWVVHLALPPREVEELEVRVHALVGGSLADDQVLGTLVDFGGRTLPVEPHPDACGHLTPLTGVEPGYVEVSGVARHPAGLARVEVTVDGGTPVRARHSLPGRAGFADDPLEGDLAGFQVFVPVPGPAEALRVEATVLGADGTRVALTPLRVPVREGDPRPFPEGRRQVLQARLVEQADLLRGVADGPPRVLVATHDLSWGGAQLYLRLLVRALRERGVDLCLVSGAGGELLAELEQELDVPVLVVGQAPTDREQLEAVRLQVASFAARHRAVGCLANTLLSFPAVSAMQTLGVPVSWVVHESFEPRSFLRQYYGRPVPADVAGVLEDALRACRDVVFVAGATRALHEPHLAPGAGTVVPYGVDLAAVDAYVAAHDRAEVRARLGLRPDSRVLVCVGAIEPRKGQLALVRAFGRLPEAVRAGAELVLVGAGEGAYVDAVREQVASAGLDGVRLVPAGPDVLPWHVAADVQVSASDIESLPRTMLEAMAVGRPVAATDVFGVGELVVDGRTGFTCEPLDLVALTEMLERVLGTPDAELARRGAEAREVVRTQHDPAGYVAYFADRVEGWLSDGRRP